MCAKNQANKKIFCFNCQTSIAIDLIDNFQEYVATYTEKKSMNWDIFLKKRMNEINTFFFSIVVDQCEI